MRRLLGLLAGVAVLLAVAAADSPGARDGGPDVPGAYRVRAIFDDAAAAAPGEDVKVAGARIGSIASLDVTPDRKAAVTLKVDDARFEPFHADATCTLRPEGVLAVKFVECDPGHARRPPLALIAHGRGAGDHLLPLARTSSPVDVDLVNDIMRKPTGQQLAILLDELGTGLAGRGSDLNAVLRRADPALRQTDRVLRVLRRQSGQLAQFARDADTVLGPLARDRDAIAGFVVHARRAGEASATRAAALRASLERFPRFLVALRRQMTDLAALTGQADPALASLARGAPALSRATEALGPFARAATPAFVALGGDAARTSARLRRTRPLLRRLRRVGSDNREPATELDALTTSLDRDDGIRHLMGTLRGAATTMNGYDDAGHYLRTEVLSGACSEYTGKGFFGCDAQWGPAGDSAKPFALGTRTRAVLDYLLGR